MYMIMLVLNDPNQLDHVLAAWREIGIHNATINQSTGSHRRHTQGKIHGRYLFGHVEAAIQGHYTLWVIVPDLDAVQTCQAATESVIGDLAAPETGVLVAWELAHVKGINSKNSNDVKAD